MRWRMGWKRLRSNLLLMRTKRRGVFRNDLAMAWPFSSKYRIGPRPSAEFQANARNVPTLPLYSAARMLP